MISIEEEEKKERKNWHLKFVFIVNFNGLNNVPKRIVYDKPVLIFHFIIIIISKCCQHIRRLSY